MTGDVCQTKLSTGFYPIAEHLILNTSAQEYDQVLLTVVLNLIDV